MNTQQNRIRRAARVRSKIKAVSNRPRLHIFKSLRFISMQAIDDTTHTTLAAVHEKQLKEGTREERLVALGTAMAEELKKAKVTKVVFDRGSYPYHGVIAKVADSIRKAGIEF